VTHELEGEEGVHGVVDGVVEDECVFETQEAVVEQQAEHGFMVHAFLALGLKEDVEVLLFIVRLVFQGLLGLQGDERLVVGYLLGVRGGCIRLSFVFIFRVIFILSRI